MESFKINVDVQGQEIFFVYKHFRYNENTWAAHISDECKTVEESLTAATPEKCMEVLVPFLGQMGKVISISSSQPQSAYIHHLQNSLVT